MTSKSPKYKIFPTVYTNFLKEATRLSFGTMQNNIKGVTACQVAKSILKASPLTAAYQLTLTPVVDKNLFMSFMDFFQMVIWVSEKKTAVVLFHTEDSFNRFLLSGRLKADMFHPTDHNFPDRAGWSYYLDTSPPLEDKTTEENSKPDQIYHLVAPPNMGLVEAAADFFIEVNVEQLPEEDAKSE